MDMKEDTAVAMVEETATDNISTITDVDVVNAANAGVPPFEESDLLANAEDDKPYRLTPRIHKRLWAVLAILVTIAVPGVVTMGVAMNSVTAGSRGDNGTLATAVPDGPAEMTSDPLEKVSDDPPEVLAVRNSNVDQVIAYVVNASVSDLTTLTTIGSPQNRAAIWMAEQDAADTAVPTDNTTAREGYNYMVRFVMAVFYYSTGGDNWTVQYFSMTFAPVCDWNNVIDDTYRRGILCDDETGLVFGLDFDSNNLVGTLPRELGALTTLEYLSVSSNAIEGELPSEICSLLQLEFLEIGVNSIGGSIPTCIMEMSNLQMIFLSSNVMTGPLPSTIATLSKLEGIIVDNNFFTGDVTNLFNDLPMLRFLHLGENQFQGTITDSFLAGRTDLLQLDLSSSSLEGSLPAHFLAMSSLQFLDLHDNLLTGPIPENVLENNELFVLALQDNRMTGPLPPTLANLRALVHLDVSSNAFNGNFPAQIGTMSNLKYFFASGANSFTPGFIPDFFGDLTNLEELGLKSTNRLGEVPAFLGDLKDLVFLDLDDNMLSGSLPFELAQLTKLEFLLLNRNELSGEIPSEFRALTSLRVAFLDQTALSGSFAPLCELPAFQEPTATERNGGAKLLIADCGGGDPKIVCECCTICCSSLDRDCNKNTAISNMDPTWWASYSRNYFILGDETIFLASDIAPAEP